MDLGLRRRARLLHARPAPRPGAERPHRYATAFNPVPYAGGSVPSLEAGDARRSTRRSASSTTPTTARRRRPTSRRRRSPPPSGRTFNKTDLQYITQENVASCSSTSGGGSGRFVIANLAGSYGGQAWDPNCARSASDSRPSATSSRSSTTTRRVTCRAPTTAASCSAHWFTVVGDMVAIAFYSNGTRILDVSDPTDIKQAALHPDSGQRRGPAGQQRLGAPTGTTATSTSPTTAAASTCSATPARSRARCSRSCAGTRATTSQTPPKVRDEQTASVGATVPATLALSLGTPATFGAFTPGVAARLQRVVDRERDLDGRRRPAERRRPVRERDRPPRQRRVLAAVGRSRRAATSPAGTGSALADVGGSAAPTSLLTYGGPISNDPVTLNFRQRINANDALQNRGVQQDADVHVVDNEP